MIAKGRAVKSKQFPDELLVGTIRNRHKNMLQVTRHRLNNLFLEVGNLLRKTTPERIMELAPYLQTVYGVFFSEVGLGNMKQVAAPLTDDEVREWLTTVLNWDQLVAVSSITDRQGQLEYIQQAVESGEGGKGLHDQTEYEARKMITDKEFNNSIRAIKARTQIKQPLGLQELFIEPFFAALRPLLAQNQQPLAGTDQLYRSISMAVDTFSNRHNAWLNAYLNFSFLEVGKGLNQLFPENGNVKGRQQMLRALRKTIKTPFDEDDLLIASRFATWWSDKEETIELASLISWPYIRLLPLEQIQTSLLYARLAAEQGWTAEALSQQIKSGGRDLKESPIHDSSRLPLSTVARTSKKIERKRNHIVTASTIALDIRASIGRTNILDNPYFPLIRS